MADSRRYIFHGHAAALGGRIVRMGQGKDARLVKDGFIDLPASALTVAGGRSTASLDASQLNHPDVRAVVRFAAATVKSEGTYDDVKGYFEATLGQRDRASLAATTSVHAEVTGLDVGIQGKVRMVVPRLRVGLVSQSASSSGETPVQLDPATGFDKDLVTFVDEAGKTYRLQVKVERELFQTEDTYSKFTAAASTAKFAKKYAHTVHLPEGTASQVAPQLTRTDGGSVQGTIVRPLQWSGPAFPGYLFDPDQRRRLNEVLIPGLGTIAFGEVTLARQSRRVTMILARLGSPAGGDMAAGDVQDNGGWSS